MNVRRTLAAGSATLLLLAATLALAPATAEEEGAPEEVRKHKDRPERHHGPVTIVMGFGGAAAGDEVYRSHMRLVVVQTSNDETTAYVVKRGMIDIGYGHGGHRYGVVPDTWTIAVEEQAFAAEGKVEDREGNLYPVILRGELLHDAAKGNLYFVKGELGEAEHAFSLYYLAMVHKAMKRADAE